MLCLYGIYDVDAHDFVFFSEFRTTDMDVYHL